MVDAQKGAWLFIAPVKKGNKVPAENRVHVRRYKNKFHTLCGKLLSEATIVPRPKDASTICTKCLKLRKLQREATHLKWALKELVTACRYLAMVEERGATYGKKVCTAAHQARHKVWELVQSLDPGGVLTPPGRPMPGTTEQVPTSSVLDEGASE